MIDYKTIRLRCEKLTLVDTEDYEWLMRWEWSLSTSGYANRSQWVDGKNKNKIILMHRLIINTPDGMDTDHINGNKLDNRRCNLRVATRSQNLMNQKKSWGGSKYKGVSWHKNKGKWVAYIETDKKMKHLGIFVNEHDAATAYNMAALRYFRKFAKLNLIPAEAA